MKEQKIAVAYSGGLDTSVIIRWLQEHYNARIITVTTNLGQKKELAGVAQKAYKTGAVKAYVPDLRKTFVNDYVFRALKAGALYEQLYPMATSIGRPLIAKSLVEIAKREKCSAVVHGCTGKGNDQVRLEVSIMALAPELKVIAPLREWEFKSREDEIAYAEKHNIPVTASKAKPYSIDENLWGTAIECGVLEDPMAEPPEDAYILTTSPAQAPNTPEVVTIRFKKGIPVALNGKKMDGVTLIDQLNAIGGKHAIGRLDLVENRLVGIKSREVYEAPAATILHFSHSELERLTLEKDVMHYKTKISHDYADIIYNGLWFTPLREALDKFIDKTQECVSGLVKVRLYKGSVTIAGRTSPYSLYDSKLATYSAEDTFDHQSSEGFIKIYGLPIKTVNALMRKKSKIPRIKKR